MLSRILNMPPIFIGALVVAWIAGIGMVLLIMYLDRRDKDRNRRH